MKHELRPLPYPYDALEPHIDARTMEIHYTKHHQSYVDKLNATLEKYPELQKKTLEELLKSLDSISPEIRTAVRNHGGGHWNHSFFWKIMTPRAGGGPTDKLAVVIDKNFGDFINFKKEFSTAAANLFGSGWVWLAKNGDELKIITTPNQDSPISQNLKPIVGLDIWEHAYYLKYQNRRTEYIEAWWNVVNWRQAEENFLS